MNLLTLGIVGGAFLAGFIQGLSGFAYALIATTIWVWFVEPKILVPLVLSSSLVGQIATTHAVGSHISMARVSPFLIGALVGVPIGVSIFHMIDANTFRVATGVILIVYCSVMLLIPGVHKVAIGGRASDTAVGVVSGVMGGLGGLSGPAPVIWCALRGWDKDVQRATFQPLFILVSVLTLLLYAVAGDITADILRMLAIVAPVVLVSSWLGTRVYRRLPEQAFRQTLLLLLLLSGVTLVLPMLVGVFGGNL